MSKLLFSSVLASQFECYIALQQAAGADYRSPAQRLNRFDRFLSQEDWREHYLSSEIVESYIQSLLRLSDRTRHGEVCLLRRFCTYMRQFHPDSYVPDPVSFRNAKVRPAPYIFTEMQVKALLQAALKLPPQGSLRPMTAYTMFGLIYSCGLRISEAIGLDLADVHLSERKLFIHKSKFQKSRWVPMSPSTTTALGRYIERRSTRFPITPQDPVFVHLRGRRFFHQTVYSDFRQALRRCGLRGGRGSPGPRIHDLRHAFACNRLLEWYRQGRDVNALLPSLATYMGHTCIRYTQTYLHATPELIQVANERFYHNFRTNILPQRDSQ
jgi:integrase/recombinase XerD